MLGQDKKTLMVPISGVVEACLDYTPSIDTYALRIESFEQRLVILTDETGSGPFLELFGKFLEDCALLKEATLDYSTSPDLLTED